MFIFPIFVWNELSLELWSFDIVELRDLNCYQVQNKKSYKLNDKISL